MQSTIFMTSSCCQGFVPRLDRAAAKLNIAEPAPRSVPRSCVVLQSSDYSFAKVEPKEMSRMNRGKQKREANDLRDVAVGMCLMTEKQLKAVTPIAGDAICDAVRIAAKIPRTNQGRKRQESLVVKLMRTQLRDSDVDKLRDAVELSRTSQNSYVDLDVQAQVDVWREMLLNGDQEALQEVLTRLARLNTLGGDAAAASDTHSSETDSDDQSDADDDMEEGGSSTSRTASQGAGGLAMTAQELRMLVKQCQAATESVAMAQSPGSSSSNNCTNLDGGEGNGSKSRLDVTALTKRRRKLIRALNATLKNIAIQPGKHEG